MKFFNIIILVVIIFKGLVGISQSQCVQRFCGILGAQCGGKINGLSCSPNYYCSDGRCIEGKLINKACNSTKACQLGLECIYLGEFKVCKPINYLGNGEKCNSTDQCLGNLQCDGGGEGGNRIDRVCSLIKLKGNCTENEDCESHQYCNYENQCVNKLQRGSSCQFKKDQCTFDCICSKDNNGGIGSGSKDNINNYRNDYLKGTCLPLFSKKNGETCFAQYGECDQKDGLVCPSVTGYISTCQTITNIGRKNCSTDNDCDTFWQTCECDGNISNSTCHSKFNIDGTCSMLYFDFQSCLSGHFCQVDQDIGSSHELLENSCLMKYCQQEAVCFYQRCLVSEFGGCSFPDYLKCKREHVFLNFQLKSRTGNYTDGFGDDFIENDSSNSTTISSTENNHHRNNNSHSNETNYNNNKNNNNNNSSFSLSYSIWVSMMIMMITISLIYCLF